MFPSLIYIPLLFILLRLNSSRHPVWAIGIIKKKKYNKDASLAKDFYVFENPRYVSFEENIENYKKYKTSHSLCSREVNPK